MPHGGPDWGTEGPVSTIYSIQDLGELAARLGSIVTFDRRGNVIWFDDFESGIEKWKIELVGAGAAASISSVRARNRGFSAKLVTGSTLLKEVNIIHNHPFPKLSKIGFEISFTHNSSLDYYLMDLSIYDGSDYYDACIYFILGTGELQLVRPTSDWVTFATGINLSEEPTLFNTAKLVADFVNKKYVRLILNNTIYDLSGYLLNKEVQNVPPFLTIGWLIRGGSNDISYSDDVIITQNEP